MRWQQFIKGILCTIIACFVVAFADAQTGTFVVKKTDTAEVVYPKKHWKAVEVYAVDKTELSDDLIMVNDFLVPIRKFGRVTLLHYLNKRELKKMRKLAGEAGAQYVYIDVKNILGRNEGAILCMGFVRKKE